jgi:hypothetical protein
VARGGNGFRGAYRYLRDGKKDKPDPNRVRWSKMRNLMTEDVDRAPAHMRAVAKRSARCEKPVYHMVISWRQDENPTDDLMEMVADGTLADMGLSEHQAVLIAHDDTAHRHLHLLINRVHPETGKAWHTGKDYARLEQSMARQAILHSQIIVPGRHNSPEQFKDTPKHVRNSEFRMHERVGGPMPKDRWSFEEIKSRRTQLNPIFESARSWDQLSRALETQGLSISKKGQGLIISDAHGFMKLSDLGKQIRLKGLEYVYRESFADYDERRVIAAKQAPQQKPAAEDEESSAPLAPPDEHDQHPDHPKLGKLRHLTKDRRDNGGYDRDERETEAEGDDEAYKQRLRDEARQRRIEEREQELAARRASRPQNNSSAAEDGSGGSPDFKTEPRPSPAVREDGQEDRTARSDAHQKLSGARERLDFAYALGGLVDEEQLEAAREEVERAEEDLQKHLTFAEKLAGDVADGVKTFTAAQKAEHEHFLKRLANLLEDDEQEDDHEHDQEQR